jgi:hypothetical protein
MSWNFLYLFISDLVVDEELPEIFCVKKTQSSSTGDLFIYLQLHFVRFKVQTIIKLASSFDYCHKGPRKLESWDPYWSNITFLKLIHFFSCYFSVFIFMGLHFFHLIWELFLTCTTFIGAADGSGTTLPLNKEVWWFCNLFHRLTAF